MSDRDEALTDCIACCTPTSNGEFCSACAAEIDRAAAEKCPYCLCAPCADPDGCRREASREARAERVRDGEVS